MNDYICILATRNRHRLLTQTLSSLQSQTLPPRHVIVFDDGSSPPVARIVSKMSANFIIIRRKDEGYDIRRLVKNWNICLRYAFRMNAFSHVLIGADDLEFPPEYAEKMLSAMDHDGIGVASGSRGLKSAPDGHKPPEGAGRFITREVLDAFGRSFPERAGYEPWIFLEAERRGFKVKAYDIPYRHLSKLGGDHGFTEWGHMAWTLGYDPVFFTARCIKNLWSGEIPPKAIGRMYLQYLADHILAPKDPFYSRFDDDFRAFVRKLQHKRLRTILRLASERICI